MSLPQYLYLGSVAVYLLFMLLFCRLLFWKRYADRRYWRARPNLTPESVQASAQEAGLALPYLSILIPARDEADVIEHTIDHMASLSYPAERWELVVITDERERRAAAADQPRTVGAAHAFLRRARAWRWAAPPPARAEGLVLGLLCRLAVESGDEVRRHFSGPPENSFLVHLPPPVLRALVWETARQLWLSRGRSNPGAVQRMLCRRAPAGTRDADLSLAYAALVSYALPAVAALARLQRSVDYHRLLDRLTASAARAHHSLTREILCRLCDQMAGEIGRRLADLLGNPDRAQAALAETYREVYPTTHDILARKAAEFAARPGRPRLVPVEVPVGFDGRLGGRVLPREVPSTKGRALNWGLGFIDPRTEWCGFYDAESRPDRRTLLYIAHRWMRERAAAAAGGSQPTRIYQGPVFQVRNFHEMGPFCKIASLYQAIAHDWYLPALFRTLPFVGGTNLFVTVDLLREIGGYDHTSLTEDLELGTRAFLLTGEWPEYLPYPSSEQTPPTFAGFFRQRLRWATGHLEVVEKVRRGEGAAERRRPLLRQLVRKGQLEWIFYQTATLVPPLALVLWYGGLIDPSVAPAPLRSGLNAFSFLYMGFTFYAYRRYLPYVDGAGARGRQVWHQAVAAAHLLLLPLAAFLFPTPYSTALALRTVGLGPRSWVKTPRTRE